MSSTQMSNERATWAPSAGTFDTTRDAVVIPVSDVDRAKRSDGSLGWRPDADFAFANTSSCNRETWQAWRFGPDIEGGSPWNGKTS
jgi:hypothetical protein